MLRTSRWALIWTVLRLLAAIAIIAAVIGQAARTIGIGIDAGQHLPTVVTNFFSFFTILSNCAAAVVLLWAVAGWVSVGRRRTADAAPATDPAALAVALASVTTYMVITGVVYNTLLRNVDLPQGTTVPWSNEILHVVAPLFLLLDLFLGPGRRALPWRDVGVILIFPILWVVYTLVRGPLITNPVSEQPFWYPYPFLNPNNPDLIFPGYGGVAFWVVAIAAGIIVTATIVVGVGRRRGQGASGDSSATRSGTVQRLSRISSRGR
ncbi:Pr6Pr family membrane protein [Microbacterium invictum]|uniref:Pr6Pr family membrane protein n=1 Tax=Microbacterium invictum TaxID=515415 RepID=A0ABZ0VC16_9MICO|nr:Pr6Pr family membrane protein [Microbacterium invictum]WQB70428.1 Pr6Pr family membrane protein [Microbacterium invictum]